MVHGTKTKKAAGKNGAGGKLPDQPILASRSPELTELADRRQILEAKIQQLSRQAFEAGLNEAVALAADWRDEAKKAHGQSRGLYAGVRRLKELLAELPEPEKDEEPVDGEDSQE